MQRTPANRTSLLWAPLASLALGLVLSACPGSPGAVAPPRRVVALERHYYDNTGGIKDSLQIIIREPGEFERRWAQATSLQPVPPPAPAIDFQGRMVVLVGAGRMEPGAEIRVDSAAVQRRETADRGDQETLVIFVHVTQGCPGFNASSYPLEIVSLPAFQREIEFRTEAQPPTACQDR